MSNSKLIGAAVAFVLLLLHWSPWKYFGAPAIPELIFTENGGHYLTIEREFWTCLLTSLTVAFGLEGIFQFRRHKRSDGLTS